MTYATDVMAGGCPPATGAHDVRHRRHGGWLPRRPAPMTYAIDVMARGCPGNLPP
ncbi:MAG TPA: hypothetical protein VFR45_01805 [Nocardioides sp.]|nr:hypothetical protein [Nocardioides sp.]